MKLVDAIKLYLKHGWSIVPITYREKDPPLIEWTGFEIMRASGSQWNEWWVAFGGKMNLAVVLGGCETEIGTQLVCVDTDSPEQERWIQQHDVPETPTERTARGIHRFFLAPAGLDHCSAKAELPAILAGKHYAVVSPSIHPTGAVYSWEPGLALGEVSIAELPQWGVDLMRGKGDAVKPRERTFPLTEEEKARKYGKSALGQEIAELAATLSGGRNDRLNAAAFALGQLVAGGLLEESEVRAGLLFACQQNGLAMDDGERAVETTLNSGLEKGKQNPRTAPERKTNRDVTSSPLPPVESYADVEHGRVIDEETGEVMMSGAREAVNALADSDPLLARQQTPSGRLDDIAPEMIDAFEEYRNRPREVCGLRTGFPTLDRHFLGFSRFPLIVLQGQSGYGKTTFAKHCIFATALAEMATASPAWTVVFMLESNRDELLDFYLGYRWGLPREVREPGSSAALTTQHEKLLQEGYREFWKLPVIVYDDDAITNMDEIEFRIRRDAEKYPLAGVVVDHAQEVEVRQMRSRPEEVSEVARRFRNLHEKLQVPCMLISQTTMTKEGNFETQWSGDLRKKSWLCLAVDRGEPGMKREEAVQSNIMRVVNDKARGWPVCHPVTLQGDYATGRLWEPSDYGQVQSEQRSSSQRTQEASWPNNE